MDESIKKQILITGKNSYIGTMIKKYLDQFPDRYNVHLLDVRDAEWEKFDFSKWNVVINVTGIAHKSEDEVVSGDYYKINRDLCLKIAERAKEKNVSHFIQMSTMAVFGDSIEKIEKSSPLNAKTHYGLSKLQADYILQLMEDSQFHVCIVRPPMVYGKDSKGNYSKLSNFIKKIPVFIKYENKRSILYI
ncbi:TPA: NAD-dependent epimerase/dehydratase family protein, partial [Streptococcus suis]